MPSLTSIPDFLITLLAAWLGALVITRQPGAYIARVFSWLTLLTALYSAARVVEAVATVPAVVNVASRIEYGVGALLPAALLHIVFAFTSGSHADATKRIVTRGVYGVSAAFSLFFLL